MCIETCETCRFVQPYGEHGLNGPPTFYGDCRIYAPQMPRQTERWPSVRKADWCGEWESEKMQGDSGGAGDG